MPSWLVPSCLGLVFIAAGTLKGYQLAFETNDESTSTLLLLVFSDAEILGGLWMLSGLNPERTRIWASAVFIGLAASSLFQALDGKCTCGCFGPLSPTPWSVFLFDIAAVAGLSLAQGRAKIWSALSMPPLHLFGMACLSLIVLAVTRQQAEAITVEGKAVAENRPLGDVILLWTGDTGKFMTQTDGDGNFRLSNIAPGYYAVSTPDGMTKELTSKPLKPTPKKKTQRSGPRDTHLTPRKEGELVRWIELKGCSKEHRLVEFN
ncbi:carboxypeptidase-like regulatory domain-containing protein [Singulisphaera rosea]